MEAAMIVKDPIHREIPINDGDIIDLIQTAAFRRLAGLKQQGNTHFLLPGATHNRYSHSLGVYANIRKMTEHLMSSGSIALQPHEIKIGLVSALLHDIGHGPFSHCFESITGIHHERWTARMIAEHGEIAHILSRTPGLTESVLSVIERRGDFPVLEQLLFSQIGADALDYHARDWFHSGIGEDPFELDTLIQAVHVHQERLVIRREGVPQIEKLVRIKRALFEQGFQHPDVIGKDVLLKLLFKRAKHLFRSDRLNDAPKELLPLFGGTFWPVSDYARLSDESICRIAAKWAEHEDPILSSISRTYMAPIQSSIAWEELGGSSDASLKTGTEALFTSETVSQQIKYGCYKSGICVTDDSGFVVDVSELSEPIREHSRYDGKQYFFHIR